MTEKSSQRAIKATGCGYGGGTVLSLQHIFRGSCRGWQGDVPTGRCTAWGSKHQSAVVPADDPAADPVCTGRSAAGKGAKQKEHHRYDTKNTILQKDIPSFSVCGGVKLIGVQEFKSGD